MSTWKRFLDVMAELLGSGHCVRFRARGQSMYPTIQDGEMIVVEAVQFSDIKPGDVLLYQRDNQPIAHRVVSLAGRGDFILRGDASQSCDAPVKREQILGRVISVERRGRRLDLTGRRAKLRHRLRVSARRVKNQLAFCLFLLCLILSASPAWAQTNFVQDTFTGANNTLLQNHNPDIGDTNSWSKASGPNSLAIQNNSLVTTSGGQMDYVNTTDPTGGTADYVVGITGRWQKDGGGRRMFLYVRADATLRNGYCLEVRGNGRINIIKIVNGISTTIATDDVNDGGDEEIEFEDGQDIAIRFAVQGSTLRAIVSDGTTTATLSGTDTMITSAGHAGLGIKGQAVDISADDFFASTFAPTAVEMMSLGGARFTDGVLLRWQTGYEVDNLGFTVYREEEGRLRRVTKSLIAGSAFLVGAGTVLTAGRSYSWWDDLPSEGRLAQYWIEAVDLNGERTRYGPIKPIVVEERAGVKRASALLSQLSQSPESAQTGYAVRSNMKPETVVTGEQINRQQALAAQPAVKLLLRARGWYRVRQPELAAAGLDPNVDPRFLQLFVDGRQRAIRVLGEADGRFDPQDGIEFYGQGLDTPWTDTRVYWLVEGSEPGQRIGLETGGGGMPVQGRSFPYTVERKDREVYFAALNNGDADNFFGSVITSEPVNLPLRLHHLDVSPPGDALLEVSLQGVTEMQNQTLDHRVRVLLNGIDVGQVAFDGRALEAAKMELSQAWLQEGENVVTLVAEGGEQDVSVVDFVRLTYWHTYEADEDELEFTASGGRQVTIDGFSRPQIRILDITDPNLVIELAGQVQPRGAGYLVSVGLREPGRRLLLALTQEQADSPTDIRPNQPSSWHRPENGANVVMLSHRSFLQSLAPLKSLRESEGRTVALIDVEDIYDEYNFGAKSPWAIKDFLRQARAAWREGPRFVLLVGDASFDRRNYLGQGDFDFVPTKLVGTVFLETASDDWYADEDGDGVPEAAVGRLPVRTAAEAARVVAKLIEYGRAGKSESWTKQALLVADQDPLLDFEGTSAEVGARLPADMSVEEIFRGQIGSSAARGELLARLNEGQLLVNYVGHGSVEVWAGGGLLTSDDARALTNGSRLPLVITMNCLNGFFHDVFTESLAEVLLKSEPGGAVAVWASSALTAFTWQRVMNEELIRLLFGQERLTLGEAMVRAKAVVQDPDVRRTWMLFGDPTTRLMTGR